MHYTDQPYLAEWENYKFRQAEISLTLLRKANQRNLNN